MTRDEAKKLLPVIQAWAEGKDVQWRNPTGPWTTYIPDIHYRPGHTNQEWRIKPELREFWICSRCNHSHNSEGGAFSCCTPHKITVIHVREVLPTELTEVPQ